MVKILRLVTGEDIVGLISESKTEYEVISPFKVIFRRLHKRTVGLTITPWLPDELLEDHMTKIGKSQVVCVTTPKTEFIDYYHRVSDEFYMTMIDLDTVYRQQLTQLERPNVTRSDEWSSLNDLLTKARMGQSEMDMFDELDEPFDDTDPPLFH